MKIIANGIEVDAAKLLAALHNGTQPLGMGRLHAIAGLSVEEATEILAENDQRFEFDYLFGRPPQGVCS